MGLVIVGRMEMKIYLCTFFTTVVFMAAVFAEHISDRRLEDFKEKGGYILRGRGIAPSEALLIAVSDPKKILKIESEVKRGRLDLLKKSRLIIDGVKARLETTLAGDPYGNINISGESVLRVKNGAVLAAADGMGARVAERASMEVDGAVFHGQFIGSAKNVVFKNGSLWYMSSFSGDDRRAVLEADILVDGSKIISLADISMNDSRECVSKVLKLQKSAWYSNKNKLEISGVLRVDDSSIVNVGNFAVGVEGGFASGRNEVCLKGSAANSVSRLAAEGIVFNSNISSPRHPAIMQGGNSVVSAGWVRPGRLTSGASRAVWLLTNDNNKIDISNDINWGDNLRGEVHKGYWILTTSSHYGGRKELATNSDLRCRFMRLNASGVENNSLGAKVDWLGNTNSITAKLDVVVGNSAAKNSSSLNVLNVGEGARLYVGRHTVIGDENARSGRASIKISDGASFTHGGHVFLHNSKNADSKSKSSLVAECSPIYRKKGIISVGVGSRRGSNALQDAISGNAILRFKNCGQILYGGGILLAGSSVDLADSGLAHKNSASLFIEDSKLTIDGELYMGHRRFGGGKIYGGNSTVELIGSNSAFISRKKGLRGGFGSAVYGGRRGINMLGKNGTVYFEGDFQMNSAKGARQFGGSFSLNILGE
ncbi:MAG: hypothetical protein J6P03_03185, partial [Opitutales bacterium]|nr:hypothetical protein [Opitutales bacterium]